VRVIAGEVKGRRLDAVKGGGTRSATDRVRETLFAILADRVEDARVLDLFAGAGTLGIEALSRGAAQATFVEREPAALAVLRRNVEHAGYGDRSEIVRADVLAYLDRAEPADVVFCDPPFADVVAHERVLAHPTVVRSGLVVARALRKHRPELPAGAEVVRERTVGEETLLFVRYRPD